jgi:hypothetical protein
LPVSEVLRPCETEGEKKRERFIARCSTTVQFQSSAQFLRRFVNNTTLTPTPTHRCILLQQLRETLKRETSKKGIWPISKQELIAIHLKQFLKFANSIDFDNL